MHHEKRLQAENKSERLVNKLIFDLVEFTFRQVRDKFCSVRKINCPKYFYRVIISPSKDF